MGTSLAHLVWWDLLLLVILLIGSLCCELRTLLAEAMHCSSLVESTCRSDFWIWERPVVTTEILFTSKIRSLHFSLHLLCLASCLESNENLTRPKRALKSNPNYSGAGGFTLSLVMFREHGPCPLVDRLGFEDYGPHIPAWTDSTRLNTAGTDHAGLCSW